MWRSPLPSTDKLSHDPRAEGDCERSTHLTTYLHIFPKLLQKHLLVLSIDVNLLPVVDEVVVLVGGQLLGLFISVERLATIKTVQMVDFMGILNIKRVIKKLVLKLNAPFSFGE